MNRNHEQNSIENNLHTEEELKNHGRRIADLLTESSISRPLSSAPLHPGAPPAGLALPGEKKRVNIAALGDVGTTMLIGLRLLGSDVLSEIGILDINENNLKRLEMEINQIRYPFSAESRHLPAVRIITEKESFNCDVFIFTASKGVPGLGSKGDVRMAQLDANRDLIRHYAELAKKSHFSGFAAIVSDPVDPLAKAFLQYSDLHPAQIQGYGLGVMSARAEYYAERDPRFRQYLTDGRAYGPHGQDLVIADSISQYNDALSRELTDFAINANVKVRELGYKPYIAPSLSSAAISILLTLRGEWHYSSLYLGEKNKGAFLGIRNRMTPSGPEYEDLPLPEELYQRIAHAWHRLLDLE